MNNAEKLVKSIIPNAWLDRQKKFHDYSADQEYAKEILKQAGW